MSAYESRIRAWAKNSDMKDFLTANIEKVEEHMHKTGRISEFYEAFPDYVPDYEVEVVMNTDRKKVLEYCTQIDNLTKEYDGPEGYLGESFCEDYLKMSKLRKSMKDMDGWIRGRSVQVKFKWINSENLESRYVTISPAAEFELLVVTCADYGDSEVCLFGIWKKEEVGAVIDAQDRVYLQKLRKRDQAEEFKLNLDSELIFESEKRDGRTLNDVAEELTIYCADIGSVVKNNFGWARLVGTQSHMDNCMVALVDDIVSTLAEGRKVALGFECPLWAPVSKKPQCLTKGRPIDGNRPWSAAAGAAALATGITQVAWILDEIGTRMSQRGKPLPSVHLDWSEFESDRSGLFLWEAFVTGQAKALGSEDAECHADDTLHACRELANRPPDSVEKCAEPRIRSLIGGAILWAGWDTNLDLLQMPCNVVRPDRRD